MPKLDRRDIKKMQRNAQRRSRFGRVGKGMFLPGLSGGGFFLPGTTGGRQAKNNGRSMPRTQMRDMRLRKGQLRGSGFFDSLKKTASSALSATKKIVAQQGKDQTKKLAQDLSNMAIEKLGGGGPRFAPQKPPNKEQLDFMKQFARKHPNRAMPALGGQVRDQDKLRRLILGDAKPSKFSKTKKSKKSTALKKRAKLGRGMIFI